MSVSASGSDSCSTCTGSHSNSIRTISSISTVSAAGSIRIHRSALRRPGLPPPYECHLRSGTLSIRPPGGSTVDLSSHPTGILILTEPIPPPSYEDVVDPPPPYYTRTQQT